MSGGGKGGKQTVEMETKIDPRLEKAGKAHLDNAEHIAKFGYQPNRNVQVAAFTPMQEAAFQNQNNAMNAWGMVAPSDPMAGMPQAQMSGNGIAGYSFAPEFDKAKAMLPEGYRRNIDNLFYDPITGEPIGPVEEKKPSINKGNSKGGRSRYGREVGGGAGGSAKRGQEER